MVKLSEFLGELVSDISDARKIIDSNSSELGQIYHADPFLKGMPVPHYTIQEAEIKIPVSVKKVVSNDQNNDLLETLILRTVKFKLPHMLTGKLMECYVRKKAREQYEIDMKKAADAENGNGVDSVSMTFKEPCDEKKKELHKLYSKKSNEITNALAESMKEFLDSSNLELNKMLDIRDKMIDLLKRIITYKLADMNDENMPVAPDDITELAGDIGTELFFEFAQQSASNKGVYIDPGTGKLSEYFTKDKLMFISLKIKEQDLDIVIEKGDDDGMQRFLSLN